jgi:adenylate cyclase
MEQDEEGTLEKVKTLQREIIERKVNTHHGRIVKTKAGYFVEKPVLEPRTRSQIH